MNAAPAIHASQGWLLIGSLVSSCSAPENHFRICGTNCSVRSIRAARSKSARSTRLVICDSARPTIS